MSETKDVTNVLSSLTSEQAKKSYKKINIKNKMKKKGKSIPNAICICFLEQALYQSITETTVEITKLKMLFTLRVFEKNTETMQMCGGSTVAPKN